MQDETEAGRTGLGEQEPQSPAYLGGCQAPAWGGARAGGRLAWNVGQRACTGFDTVEGGRCPVNPVTPAQAAGRRLWGWVGVHSPLRLFLGILMFIRYWWPSSVLLEGPSDQQTSA